MQILLVLLMFALWSTAFSFGKILLAEANPVFITAIRMLLGGLMLCLFILFWRKGDLRLQKKHLLSLLLLGIFSVYLTNICEYWGMQHLTAAKTCFIYSLSPFFAAILSYIHFKEKITLRKLCGLCIGFLGMIPVFRIQTGSEGFVQAFGIFSWADLAVAGAAFFSVYGWVLLRLVVKDKQISPLSANGLSMLIGGMLALIHTTLTGAWPTTLMNTDHLIPFASALLALTLISNVICYNLYGFMLRRFTATFLSFAGLLSPIFASLFSWLILKESPQWTILLSTPLVALGLWIVYTTEIKQGYTTLPKTH